MQKHVQGLQEKYCKRAVYAHVSVRLQESLLLSE